MKLQYEGLESFECRKLLLTKPVYDSITNAAPKLVDVLGEVESCERIFLYHGTNIYKHISVKNENGIVDCQVWVFPMEYAYIFTFDKSKKTYTMSSRVETPEARQIQPFAHWSVWEELFLQFAHLDTKILKPSRQIYDGPNCLYNNKTKSDIEIVDSTWFTTLVKSDSFKVRGHFRLQPYGHELKNRKLIWINDFVKDGYTREAKILSEHPTTAGTL